ncbi:ABC transporter permease [Dyella caseinilytica]|uniref:ABC transporter permease n=1 Tax=Dyella caseinilytica TaxID=1849581 RepID=A0ABX7GZX4_9GAMM|nr:ABC transporter permease [Dyella caseinilytica]QRN55501.1 ABC transporter permease [Dyella caseinilytica]GGA02223.1 permease [Dyella caseinilytica]
MNLSANTSFLLHIGPRLKRGLRSPAATLGAAVLLLLILIALFAPWLAPKDPLQQDIALRLRPPGPGHWLGTDALGRDLLSRLIYGSRATLGIAALVMMAAAPVGLLIGIVAGYAGGWVERVLMRFTDIVLAFPQLVLALAFAGLLGAGAFNGALAVALTLWPSYARQARAETLAMRDSDYLAAARMLGIRGGRLLWGHVLPMCLPFVYVRLALDMAATILSLSSLGFLGLGVQPPTPEWGAMVADGSKVIFDQWWVAAVPGAAILIVCIAFNLLADGLRDLGDPRHG